MSQKHTVILPDPVPESVSSGAGPEAAPSDPVLSGALPEKVSGKVLVCLNRPTGIKFTLPGGRSVRINGNGVQLRGRDMGILPVGAYGMTLLDADDWDYIKSTYSSSMPIFSRGLIFAAPDKASALAEAREKKELRNGLEPLGQERSHTRGVNAAEVM